jgi:hypothetical protein
MCTISFDKEALNITIYNQYPGLELASPVYCSNGTECHVSPSQQMNTIEASFGIAFRQRNFKGALLYKLQRKHASRADNQPSTSTASIKDATTSIYLLVSWNVGDYNREFRVCLIEYVDNFVWDEDKLWALCDRCIYQFYVPYESNVITWSMKDGSVIKTKRSVTYGLDYKLDISISRGIWEVEKPIEIDPKRSVLPLSMLIALTYAFSLFIPPLLKVNIHNQCLNVILLSPTYIIGDKVECRREPDHKVCAGDIMRSGFIIRSNDTSYGALIYTLQRRESHTSTEITRNTLSTARILVIWEISKSKELYADVLLLEHDEGFDWNKDDLEELCLKNFNKFRLFSDSATERWSLDNNVALMVMSEIMNEDHILSITISEVAGDNGARMPAHIDPER